jgi:hypothetical protein
MKLSDDEIVDYHTPEFYAELLEQIICLTQSHAEPKEIINNIKWCL